MHFLLIVAVLAVVAAAHSAPPYPADLPWARGGLVVGGTLLLCCLAGWGSVRTVARLRRAPSQALAALKGFSRAKNVYFGLVLGHLFLALLVGKWAQCVRFNAGLDGWILLDDLAILAPLILPLLVGWSCFFDVEHEVEEGLTRRLDPWGRQPATATATWSRRWSYVGLHARHYLGLVLAPVLFLLAAQDAAAWAAPSWAGPENGVYFYGPMLLLIALALPWLLARIWKTEPLARGPLRSRLEATARQAGVPLRDILIWRTDGQMINAAVAGFTPWLRYVFLTDGLLQQLSEDEIAAVVGHEVAHVKRRHVLLRVLVLCAPVAIWSAVQAWAPQSPQVLEDWLSGLGAPPLWQQALLAPAVVGVYAFLALGWLARTLEHDADAWAGALPAADGAHRPQNAEHLINALYKLAPHPEDRRRVSWLHPSIDDRCRLLRRVAQRPDAAEAWHRGVNRISLLVWSVTLAALGAVALA